MQGLRAKFRVAILILLTLWIGLLALYGLLKPISNGCVMTYMYPTYIPISTTGDGGLTSPPGKYGLYLYHEGWKKINFKEHVKGLNGVPVLFIPGNGGSYKQVRSLAAESDRAYQGGPLEQSYYLEAFLTAEEGGANTDIADFQLPNQYASRLDWFAVDLEGEHSAMDGRILEEHTEYVVYAIHRILDQYKESRNAREREGAAASSKLPKSVILVGHSMGGFVARAAIIHPHLKKLAVETILTLSTPHQSPPVALQPSLGHYFAHVNQAWKKGYEAQITHTGRYVSNPLLSHVVVVSISGGYNDYQVRSKLESLDDIVPPTHGFMISSTGMRNVWLSMEHQAILWCNQLVVQVSHTLLSLIDSRTGEPIADTQKRLAVFARMLRSGIPQSFNWTRQSYSSRWSTPVPLKDVKELTESQFHALSICPSNVHWNEDSLDKDLFIQTTTMTVLAMDGRRRWLDIQKLGSNGRSHFMFVTNLAPCFGVRLHLWPDKGNITSEMAASKRILEVTSKLVQIPSKPAPRQVEPGSQTEQASPSAVLRLSPEEMQGYRFLTISVAPHPAISGRPPPAVSMAVGQFFNPNDGKGEISAKSMLLSAYYPKEILLEENHPLAFSLSFGISLGLLPVSLSLKSTGCGITRSGISAEEIGDEEISRLCKMRCFPPAALAWDPTSGLYVFPNLDGETIVVDSSPALWSSIRGSEETTVLLMVDPHCSYKASIAVSETAAATRFLLWCGPQVYVDKNLLYLMLRCICLRFLQIVSFSVAVVFFALMQQAHAWELDLHVPSMLTAVESNLRTPFPFLLLSFIPIFLALFTSLLKSEPIPPFTSFTIVSIICYLLANGFIVLLVLVSQLLFYGLAVVHAFIKTRWQVSEGSSFAAFLQWLVNLSSSFHSSKVMRFLRVNPLLVTLLTAISLGYFVHPALSLFILLSYHALCSHNALSSFLTASFRGHARKRDLIDFKDERNHRSQQFAFPSEDNRSSSPDNSKSFGDTQLELFNHQHGLFILHLLAALMFVPSLVAWLQRIGMGHSLPWFLDSALCTGVVLHGILIAKPECNCLFSLPAIMRMTLRLDFIYLIAGCYSYLSGLILAPYKVLYGMAAIGFISLASSVLERRSREKGEPRFRRKKHSHRH